MSGLFIRHGLVIPDAELEESFIQSSGPGGQNVNKVASAVQLRFDVANSSLPELFREKLIALGGSRVSKEGVLVITARQFRDQQRNREDARARLIELIRQATHVPKRRKKTKPSKSSIEKRIEKKKGRSQLKKQRSK